MNRRNIALGTGLAAVAVVAFLVIAALPPVIIVVFAGVTVLIGGLVSLIADPDEPTLPALRTPIRGGARREVAQTAWTLGASRGRIAASGSEQLRRIADRRLRLRGVELDDPGQRAAAEAILGSLAYRVVTKPADQPIEVLRAAIRAVDALDRTDAAHHTVDHPTRRTA